MRLAILICTLPERADKLKRLTNILEPQIERHKDQVFYVVNDAGRSMPTGTKRNHLITETDSDYFCFCDDDDLVSSYYVDEMVKAMSEAPDVITFQGYMTTNGVHKQDFTIKLGSEYVERNRHYYRFPNHLCAFRRSVVEKIKFPDLYEREDYIWAKQIHDRKLCKTEVHIPLQLYHYDFETNKPPYAKPAR